MVYHYRMEIIERRVFFDRIQVIVNFMPLDGVNLQVIQRVYESYMTVEMTAQERFEAMYVQAMADLTKMEDTIAAANELATIAIAAGMVVAPGVELTINPPPEPPAE